MAVATLPIIGTPSLEFFDFLDFLPLAFLVLLIVGWQGYLIATVLGQYTLGQDQGAKCLNYKLIKFVGNNACVILFPNLFKKHKQCRGSNERTFILFLDRDIKNLKLKGAFYSFAFSILSASALVFFRLFPVALSGECLEKDAFLRPLFCYTNKNYPVNCSEIVNNTTGESSEVVCYALSTNIGLAVAAAVGFAKLVAVLVTAYVRASEFWLMKKWKRTKWNKYCFIIWKKKWNRFCFIILSIFAFLVVTGVAFAYAYISIGAKISNTPVATGELVASC